MGWYILKLAILLPLIGLMIWGSLKLAQRLQTQMGAAGNGAARDRSIKVVETMMLSPGQKLAVIEFRGREILVAASRNGFTRLAEVEIER